MQRVNHARLSFVLATLLGGGSDAMGESCLFFFFCKAVDLPKVGWSMYFSSSQLGTLFDGVDHAQSEDGGLLQQGGPST